MVDGSSMVQNQKLRCSTSAGRSSQPSAVARAVDDVVEAVEQHRHPADAAFAHRDLQRRVVFTGTPTTATPRTRASDSWPNSVAPSWSAAVRLRAATQPAGAADVQGDHGVGLDARLDDRVPVVAVPEVGQPDQRAAARAADAGEAALGVAVDLGDRGFAGRRG